ncbi:TPA: HYD1 signature containing ADP-ribosyltransferase family protein [Streptococcus suis]
MATLLPPSSSYNLYGSTKESTDTTGNPFAYNGEARDVTGLDYLRARYYDSQAGTFLTEDSYQGELTDPLSQNQYSYVHNNPVNYTDPSGHFIKGLIKGAKHLWNGAKKVYNQAKNFVVNTVKSAANLGRQALNWVGNQVNSAKQWVGQQWNNYQSRTSYRATPAGGYGGGSSQGSSSYYYTQQQQAQQRAQAEQRRQQAIRDEYTQATGIKGTPKSREGKNIFRNWGKALAKTLKHVCTTAERVGKQIVKVAKKIDWKKVAIVAVATVAAVAVTVATAGAAGPIIAAGVSGLGISGAAATVVTAAAVGAVSGAAGGAVSGFTTSVLSGDKPKDILANTFNGAVNGFVSGGLTGGVVGGVSTVTSSVTGPAARYAVDTLGETMADTIADAAQGGKVTPSSIATSLVINAVSDGVSARGVKGAKADVPKNKPKAGDVSIRKSPKDTTPVQQLALPGPKSQPLALPAPEPRLALPAPKKQLALPAPKSTPKTDFYVNPDGTVYSASDVVASSDINKLYHYTSDAGIDGILNSGQLYPSLKANNPKDVRYGNGQYFTDISPGSLTNPQLSSKFITIPFQGNKFANYIAVDVTDLGVIKGRDGVYVVPDDKSLDLSNRILDYGKN